VKVTNAFVMILVSLGLTALSPDIHAAAPPPGSAEESLQGSITVCFAPDTTTPESCDQSGVASFFVSFLEVGRVVWDAQGNACASGVETIAVPGTSVTISQETHLVGRLSNYDPTTQSGDGTGTGYSGGKCNGATFDDSGATVRSTAGFHFVISQGGKRLHSILTSLSFPSEDIGSFSISGTASKQ
jgi:hypothetical protein